jgi:hypothetical protein
MAGGLLYNNEIYLRVVRREKPTNNEEWKEVAKIYMREAGERNVRSTYSFQKHFRDLLKDRDFKVESEAIKDLIAQKRVSYNAAAAAVEDDDEYDDNDDDVENSLDAIVCDLKVQGGEMEEAARQGDREELVASGGVDGVSISHQFLRFSALLGTSKYSHNYFLLLSPQDAMEVAGSNNSVPLWAEMVTAGTAISLDALTNANAVAPAAAVALPAAAAASTDASSLPPTTMIESVSCIATKTRDALEEIWNRAGMPPDERHPMSERDCTLIWSNTFNSCAT